MPNIAIFNILQIPLWVNMFCPQVWKGELRKTNQTNNYNQGKSVNTDVQEY